MPLGHPFFLPPVHEHFFLAHAQVFGKILVHRFYISYRWPYSHTEWNFVSLLGENRDKIWKLCAVNKTQK